MKESSHRGETYVECHNVQQLDAEYHRDVHRAVAQQLFDERTPYPELAVVIEAIEGQREEYGARC